MSQSAAQPAEPAKTKVLVFSSLRGILSIAKSKVFHNFMTRGIQRSSIGFMMIYVQILSEAAMESVCQTWAQQKGLDEASWTHLRKGLAPFDMVLPR